MPIPIARMIRSPTRLTSQPAGKAPKKRMRAKTETTAAAAVFETPNSLAKRGIAGKTMPNPTATAKATAVKTATSRGIPANVSRR